MNDYRIQLVQTAAPYWVAECAYCAHEERGAIHWDVKLAAKAHLRTHEEAGR